MATPTPISTGGRPRGASPHEFLTDELAAEFSRNPTIDGLRTLMGEEKANGFVRGIGVAVLNAAPAGLNLSIDSVIANTMRRLSQADLAGIMRGDAGAISRAQTLASEEVKATQNAQPGANVHGAPSATGKFTDMHGAGQWINGQWVPAAKGDTALSTRGGNQFKELPGGKMASAAETGPGTGYSWLSPANQNIPGFSQAQVASSANFLKGIGFSREDVNDATKHMVHLQPYKKDISDFSARWREINRRRARGENVDDDVKKIEEDQNKVRSRMAPDKRKHWDRVMPIIRRQDAQKVQLNGDPALALDEGHDKRVEDNKKLGASAEIETQHKKTLTEVKSKPGVEQSDEDLAAAFLDKPAAQPPAADSGAAKEPPARTPAAKTPDKKVVDQAKPTQQRQAVNQKALNPTV